MGLDSYLLGEKYIGSYFKINVLEGSLTLNTLSYNEEVVHQEEIPLDNIDYIAYRLGHLRKASHIHNWFVENVQEWDDDCCRHYAPKYKLEELLEICKKVLEKKSLAKELLPPVDGFLFGGVEIDDYYFEVIEDAIDIIKKALEFDGDIYYKSSW